MTTKHDDVLNTYRPYFKVWQAKVVGSQPTAEMLAKVHALGLRPGKQAMANAMALRAEGVTGPQIVIVCGAPQLNRMRGLIAAGVFKRVAKPANEQGHTVYSCVVTPKGDAAIKRAIEVASRANASTHTAVSLSKLKNAKVSKAQMVAAKVGVAAVTAALVPPVAAPADPLQLPAALQR